MSILSSLYSDQGEPARFAWAEGFSARRTLSCDGETRFEIFTWLPLFPFVPVSPGAVSCRYEHEELRGLDISDGTEIFDLSTHVAAAWTFPWKHVDGEAQDILPLPTLRFQPDLDDDNRATSRVIGLPVAIERPVGAATPRIDRVTIDASFDDGATWSRVPGALVGDRWFGVVVPPGRRGVRLAARHRARRPRQHGRGDDHPRLSPGGGRTIAALTVRGDTGVRATTRAGRGSSRSIAPGPQEVILLAK